MATLSHSESRRLYSWWWDSHISPKNSKWLQENLADMDTKVKAMIKLIEEEADSFARRAEMYYKKRPELMKLVEEFYRAYRALAERYDHATVELRQAHRTMAEAFPNQAHYMLTDDSPSGSSATEAEPQKPEGPHPICTFLEPDNLPKEALGGSSEESDDGLSRKGSRQLNEIFVIPRLSAEKHNVKTQNYSESEHAGRAENEVQRLRKVLAKVQSDKDAIFLKYQKSLEKLSEMEREIDKAQKDAGGLDERASKAEIEVKILKEALAGLKAEKEARLVQYNQCLERIASLETMLSLAQLDAKGLDERAAKAETEANNLKQELARSEVERDTGLLQRKQCLEKISLLEAKITLAEENSWMLNEQIERAELEVKALKRNLAELNEEKESVAVQYQQCLEKIFKMETEILHAQENSERLHREIEMGAEKLKSGEKHCDLLEKSNQSLRLEADNLVQKIAMKDQELLEKHTELERLQTIVQEEHSHFLQIESTLQTLQNLYTQSQEEQRSLSLELKYGLQLLKDSQSSRQGFKEEMQQIVDENRTLHELNFSFTRSLKNQQMEISKLMEIKEKLEREFAVKAEESNALQREIYQIKDEIQDLNNRYQTMLQQLQTVGLNPNCIAASVKDLQNENSKLKEVCKMELNEKEALREKSKDLDKLLRENAFMEFSLSELNDDVEGLRGTLKKFQESCHVLQEEKSNLVAEESTLLSQLEIITEIMQKLFEKNTFLEKSLSDAKIELEGLKAKSSSLEELCKLLNDEKYNLLNERSILVSQLESIEARLGNLEKMFTKLEEKYSSVEKDKESTANQVEELHVLLLVQKEKHANQKHSSEARLANLENLVHLLEEGQQLGKLEFEEELDKAVNTQVEMFILQSLVEDLEQKNLALLIECEEHVEASKFSDKVISELESENLMQLVEVEFLSDEIRKFKMGISQVCGALQIDPDGGDDKAIKQEEVPISHILDNVEGLKGSLMKSQEEKQQLLVENSVLLTSLWQYLLEGEKLESKKKILEQEFENMREQHAILQKDKLELLEMNRQLRFEVTSGEEKENTMKSTLAALHAESVDLQRTNLVFQEEKSKVLEEKKLLLKSVLDLKDALSAAEDENSAILHEVLALSNLSLVYECFATEKALEQKALSELLSNLSSTNSDLQEELGVLRKKFKVKAAENLYLNESIERMGKELQEAKNANGLLSNQIANSANLLKKKETELFEMEERLQAVETLNAEFCRNVEELKMEQQESRLIKENLERQTLELSEDCINHKMEIEHLNEANESLLSDMRLLHHEVEQHRVREETLNSVLLEQTNEFELWEAEAATFYFDLQISSISEALLENKVDELTGVCKSLEDESAAKSLAIEQMTKRVSLLENEVGELKGHLSAYIPVISSFKEDFASLEHTSLLWSKKTSVAGNGEQKDAVIETSLQENSYQSLRENGSTLRPDGVSDLLSMQTRIRAVEKVMMEEIERRVKEENLTANVEGVVLTEVTDDSNLEVATCPENDNRKVDMEMELKEESAHDLNSWRTKTENGSLMKDIPFDHNSDNPASKNCKREQSGTDETAEKDCSDNSTISEAKKRMSVPTDDAVTCHQSDNSGKCQNSSSELEVEKELGVDKLELSKTVRRNAGDGKRRKILERLASDAQKLSILKMTVQDLKKKPETKKKSKKGNGTEYEKVKRQIEEVEEAVVQLLDMNDQLTKDVEESTSSLDMERSMEMEKGNGGGHIHRRRVTEQARRGSEQIGRLQFEMQNIQYVLLKLADEYSNNKGRNRFSGGTGVLLRDFIYNEKKSGKRRSKGCFCGCSRPSTSTDEE